MNTEDLIQSLAAEPAAQRGAGPEGRLLPLLLAGLAMTAAIYFSFYGPRPGLMAVLGDPMISAKTLLPLLLGLLALALALRSARPAQPFGLPGAVIWAVPMAAAALFVLAYLTTDPAQRMTGFIGGSIMVCLPSIPLLSLPILAGMIAALRRGAPVHPVRSGALAGLAAAGLAAAIYSTFCTEDTPLFYAVWYSTAIGIATGIGALAGARWLRW
ncbi:NrsF family protein [Pseudooceanicola algae]|uniref:Anti-sigma-F factor NrsF n=1 Tax=Pseudooceanicola algae TaxID=1537215 RepID=A0A418SGT4_9RHOB|nr:DUF1109 domain-containing protein [Pseudooceanicola algae]QPM88910.1 Anti-sigma-F factor NrsF [Pseudooceanicola algae]